MPELNVKFQSLEDAASGIGLIEGMTPTNAIESQRITVAIQEGGMASGKTSLMFILEYPNPVYRYFQLSGALFEGLCGAYKGAQERFGQVVEFNLNTNQDAQQKLLDAGFTLYRFDVNRLEVKYCGRPGAWKLHSKGYASKAELERARKELMKDPKALEG